MTYSHTATPAGPGLGKRIDATESFRVFARLTGADTVAFPSRCGHTAPACETAAIGRHVLAFLD